MDIPRSFLDAPAALVTHDLPYLPLPNRVEVVLSGEVPPPAFTRSAFMLGLTQDTGLVLARNQARGLEVPGGHIEPGESAAEAAIREASEEAGLEVSEAVPIGYLRLVSDGTPPEGWRYPHPIGFQAFFAGRVTAMHPYRITPESHLL